MFCGGQRDALTNAMFMKDYRRDAGPSTATAGLLALPGTVSRTGGAAN
jgi:hypothetical protein